MKQAMKLRKILLVLSLLALLSVWAGGYLYYSFLRETALKDAHRQAALHTDKIKYHLSSFLLEYLKSVRALAGLKELGQALSTGDDKSLASVNSGLDHFNNALGTDVCYLMDSKGNTIASSNRNAPDSFVGKNYAFRPYFQKAMRNRLAIYMATGITSKKRGIYYSHPVYEDVKDYPIGVIVIKAPIDLLEKNFSDPREGVVMVTDPHGIVFISNLKDWICHFLWKPSPEDITQVARSRQFGEGPWNWTGLQMKDGNHAIDLSENEYVIYRTKIDNYPGWNIIYLNSVKAISKRVSDPLIKMTGLVILTIGAFTGFLVFFLYRKASYHITQRKIAEEALRESEETALALLNAPTEGALLLDTTGTILALNKTAAKRFERSVDELIGMNSFDLFPPDIAKNRKTHHESVVRSGKPFRYDDRRKGMLLNNNLYPVFDAKGRVVRVAVFSRDITDQQRAEKNLKLAKEKLISYSRNLEKQVRKRTREIMGILKYSPAVIFITDKDGRIRLVNSRFEAVFGVRNDEIQGKDIYNVLPKGDANRFRASDQQVLSEGCSCQEEVLIAQDDGVHTYLSIKFPLYDERGGIGGLCGIATDITALKKAQDQLRRLSGRIINGQEKERTAIARELHDELGQMLTALRMDSVWIREHLKEKDPEAGERALTMSDLIDKTIDEVRAMAIRLRPGALDDLGLIAALDWYTADFDKRTGIACRFKQQGVTVVSDIVATAAYRITQEALTNVARHAFATRVDVSLQTRDGDLILWIIDNGRGFNTQKLSDFDCLGIAGMRERASLVGGSLEIRSQPEKGTAVCFTVSIKEKSGVVH
jgi:PAS domain S-box-containing protein